MQVDEEDVEDVLCTWMHTVNRSGGTEKEIQARLGEARAAHKKLSRIWMNSQFNRQQNQLKIFQSNVLAVLLNEWMTNVDDKKLDAVFSLKSLCRTTENQQQRN